MSTRKDSLTKKDLEDFKTEMIHQFHMISEGLIDQIKLLAEGHSGIIEKLAQHDNRFEGIETRLDRLDIRLLQMERENERQHLETRALVKLSFSELDKRLSTVESQLKELQEWRKQVEARLQL
jgi:hypothetical protein